MKNPSLLSLSLVTIPLLFGCTRSEDHISKITIKTPVFSSPNSGNAGQVALPANKKVCYGINVTGPGIAEQSIGTTACAPKVGVIAGYAPENSELSVEVPKGADRVFELLIYLADAAGSCPVFSSNMMAGTQAYKTYSSGKTAGINIAKEFETVKINLDFPGETASIASTCSGPVSLKAVLQSNGDLIDATTNAVLSSQATTESAYLSPIADSFQIGILSSGGIVNLPSTALPAPPYVFSLTRKPDTGEFFALDLSGQILQLTQVGSVMTATPLTAANCPFAVTSCKVAPWLQSISAGYGTSLYGLDHGGNIYALSDGDANLTGVTVEPHITQVSFY